MAAGNSVFVYIGAALSAYGFGEGHPFGPDRLAAFWTQALREGLDARVQVQSPVCASRDELLAFHTEAHIAHVQRASVDPQGYLDGGDTPAFAGIYDAAATVAGTSLAAAEAIVAGCCRRAFVPIAGLHHARRDAAAGFCVFNDCGVVIELLRQRHGLKRIAYVDIDAHHGDGVFYAFEDDPDLIFADLHEDGRFLYPGTGALEETGVGAAAGTKLNVPMPPRADDAAFLRAWESVEAFVDAARPDFILLQCGADSLEGDPITHLHYTAHAHAHATRRLCSLAERHCEGRLLAMGGGGYNRANLAAAWTAVVRALLEAPIA